MLLSDAPGPTTSEREAKRLGFADALKGIANHSFHQVQYSNGSIPVGLDPIQKVRSKLGVKNR